MRITKLYLKGFIAIMAAQKKREIEIIFPEDKVIHLLYGDMGSGKTFILGHCQPWHNFGTLDPRNDDKQILDNENGIKVIEYQLDKIHYIIQHEFIWVSRRHVTKHYIKKDGEELNPNGNLSSFSATIYTEFGIEQDYLKLFRIGDNVINMISMKGIERKRFIAMMLQDSQIYLILHRKMNADLKALNAQAAFVMNHLGNLNFTKLDELTDQLVAMKELTREKSDEERALVEEFNQNRGILQTKLDGMTFTEYHEKRVSAETEYELCTQERKELEQKLIDFASLSVEEVSKEIGEANATLHHLEDQRELKRNEYLEVSKELDHILNQLSLFASDSQRQQLQVTYQTLAAKIMELEKEVRQFPYDFSHQTLLELLSIAEAINLDLMTILTYDTNDILTVIAHGQDAVRQASKQAQILRIKAQNISTDSNNLQYSGTYQEPYKLFRAAFCPSKDCPYYQTHPARMKKENKRSEIVALVQKRTEEITQLETKIARLESFPTILTLFSKIQRSWNAIFEPLNEMKLLKETRLELVIGKRRDWIDLGKLTIYIELAQKRTELYTLRERLLSAKDQLNRIELSDRDKLEEEKGQLVYRKDSLSTDLEKLSTEIKSNQKRIESLNETYLLLSSKTQLEQDLQSTKEVEKTLLERIKVMKENEELYHELESSTALLRDHISEVQAELKKLSSDILQLTVTIDKIHDLKLQHEELLKKIELYTLIIDAVSPKTGIPLHMIEMYMNGCLDTINDLISGIFDDDLEIERFAPKEDSFYIPYNRNGHSVDDISKASQGEKSIIGIAISFAMMQQSAQQSGNRMKYNIPLLDEPDGALHVQDRERFLAMLLRHMKQIHGEQVIVISHNQTFEGFPLHLILTSDSSYETTENQIVTRI